MSSRFARDRSKSEIDSSLIGSIARRLLRWMWITAKQLPAHQGERLNDVAGTRVLPIVVETSKSAPTESRNIIQLVLDRLGSPDSSSHDAFWLAQGIKYIIESDPELATVVYERMFYHPERSEEKTVMGGGDVW